MGKDFLTSKATWGAIVLLLSPLLDSIQVNHDTFLDAIMTVVQNLDNGVGAGIFLWGQLTRKQPITTIVGIPNPFAPKGL